MYKIFSATFLASIFRLLFSLLFNKVIAVYFGPSGLIFFSNFQNILQLSSRFSNVGVETGLATEVSGGNNRSKKFITNSLFMLLVASTINALLFLLFYDDVISLLTSNISFDINPTYIIWSFIVFGPLIGLCANHISIINGLELSVVYSKAIIFGSIFNLLLLCVFFFYVQSYLIPIIWGVSQSVFTVFFLLFLKEKKSLLFNFKIIKVNFPDIKILLSYSKMTLLSIIGNLVSVLVFRYYVTSFVDIEEAGGWQAIVKLTETINGMFFLAVSFYLIPKCRKVTNWSSFVEVVYPIIKLIVCCYALGLFFLYFASDLIITLLFSKEFVVDFELVLIQLLGGLMHLLMLTVGVALVVNRVTKYHYIVQITSMVLVLSIGYFMVLYFGFMGAVTSFLITSLILFVMNIFLVRRWFFNISATSNSNVREI